MPLGERRYESARPGALVFFSEPRSACVGTSQPSPADVEGRMAIRGGAVGVVALSFACVLTAPTVRAQVMNGLSLVEYTRDWDGRTENYYAIGDAALVRGLEE